MKSRISNVVNHKYCELDGTECIKCKKEVEFKESKVFYLLPFQVDQGSATYSWKAVRYG